jgi:hypothetical protein
MKISVAAMRDGKHSQSPADPILQKDFGQKERGQAPSTKNPKLPPSSKRPTIVNHRQPPSTTANHRKRPPSP